MGRAGVTAEVVDRLVGVTRVVDRTVDDVGRTHGLTPQQVQLLAALVDGPIGMGHLARRLHLGRSSTTGLVDRSERRGLVERVRDGSDGRACRVALTVDGTTLARAADDGVRERLGALIAVLPNAERRALGDLTGRLLDGHRAATEDG